MCEEDRQQRSCMKWPNCSKNCSKANLIFFFEYAYTVCNSVKLWMPWVYTTKKMKSNAWRHKCTAALLKDNKSYYHTTAEL